MKTIVPILLVLFLSSCSAVKVHYDYDKDTDFSSYTTYNYYPDMETGLSGLDNKRLMAAIDSTLRGKGILLSEEPEFYVAIVARSIQAARNNTVGVGVGGSGGHVGGGLSVGIPVGAVKIQREIRFDLVDSQKDELFWQAITVDSFGENIPPELKEKKLGAMVARAFEKYPPKK